MLHVCVLLYLKVVTISYVVPCVLALEEHLYNTGSTHLRQVRDALRVSLKRRFKGMFTRAGGGNPGDMV